ncbi:lipase domain-containing protein [Phthorimaea operculella]|nr:lipase domain-containing protein [Phthorimaea operculella]
MHGIAITAPAIAYSHNPRIQGLVAAELHISPSRRRPLEGSPKGYSNYIRQCYDHLPSNQSQLSALVEFIELRFVRSEMYGKILVFLVVCSGVMIVCEDTGYPAGYMADCPGMNRSTTFSEATKESLNVVMIKPSSDGLLGRLIGSQEKRCQLSKDGANCAAKFLDLKGRKLQVLISGYMDASFSPLVRMISSTYLARGRNLAVVEIFPVLVRTYPVAARLTKPLGEVLGTFLAELTLKKGVSPSQIELVGGSLGAHIASFAAVKYSELTGRKPARLTGKYFEISDNLWGKDDVLDTFLAELTLKKGVSPSQIELVGGSLGAHIVSFAAVKYSELTGRKPARLTGECFELSCHLRCNI